MTAWQLGTVGFGYKQWLGTFYPRGMPSAEFLPHYANYFSSVEIDSTFYGTPKASAVTRWRQLTPANFRFSPKTPRGITHEGHLPHNSAAMVGFCQALAPLDEKLGPILIQLPPAFRFEQFDDLRHFLDALPSDCTYAIEFRDRSWRRGRVLERLRQQQIAWVCADYIHMPPEVLISADFTYLRFIGIHGQFATKDRELIDQTERLKMWQAKLTPHLDQLHTVYGYFNNDFSGHSPATCNRMKTLIGLKATYPQIAQQGSLF